MLDAPSPAGPSRARFRGPWADPRRARRSSSTRASRGGKGSAGPIASGPSHPSSRRLRPRPSRMGKAPVCVTSLPSSWPSVSTCRGGVSCPRVRARHSRVWTYGQRWPRPPAGRLTCLADLHKSCVSCTPKWRADLRQVWFGLIKQSTEDQARRRVGERPKQTLGKRIFQ